MEPKLGFTQITRICKDITGVSWDIHIHILASPFGTVGRSERAF